MGYFAKNRPMMGPGFAERIARDAAPFVIGVIGLAFALGALAMWGLPKLWAWLKPLLHGLTS